MQEKLSNAAWGVGLRMRNMARSAGLLGPFEPVLLKMAPHLVRPPKEEFEVDLPSGMKMVVPPGFPAARSFAAGLYEPVVSRLFKCIVREGMTVVDVGANVGYYALLACALTGTTGRIYALEPDPTAYSCLLRNIMLNSCPNIAAVGEAVSNVTGVMTFIRDLRGAEGFLTSEVGNDDSIVVNTVTLDDFFAGEGWPSVGLIKMDIEGGEAAALEGMRELSRRNPQVQLIMEHDLGHMRRAGTTPEALARLLQELGFRSGYIAERGMKPFSLASGLPRSRATYNLLLRKE